VAVAGRFLPCPVAAVRARHSQPSAPGGRPGRPDFTLKDLGGQSYSLSTLRGKVVIVNFWATWCPAVPGEMPSMELLHRELADEGLVMLAVNIEKEGRQSVPRFLATSPHTFPVLFDDQEVVQKRYGVYTSSRSRSSSARTASSTTRSLALSTGRIRRPSSIFATC